MRKALTAAALLLALLLLPATAWAQAPPDDECTPAEEQYEGDCTPEVVNIVDPQDDEPSPDGDDPGSSGVIDDDADLDDGANFDDDVDDAGDNVADASTAADGSVSPAPVAPASASATAAATASATASAAASASASPASQSEALPETGGTGGVALAAAVLLASTGLLARWAVNRR